MVAPITKYAKKIESVEELITTLPNLIQIATSGRMGPVLLDVPMNIQKAEITSEQRQKALAGIKPKTEELPGIDLRQVIRESERNVVVIGAGAALSGVAPKIQDWCERNHIPYVSSWGALTYLDRSRDLYFGSLGVYGARSANWIVQAADNLIVFGSRLDNRQRTGNPRGFAPFAKITVFDIDVEELKKYKDLENYNGIQYDLTDINSILVDISCNTSWPDSAKKMKSEMSEGFDRAVKEEEFNPYTAVRIAQSKFEKNAIVVSDCGANLCWVYQSYLPDSSFLFTAGGNSPMGYSLPAAIGAQLLNPDKKVYCFIGDGGLQMNIQELQTIVAYNLPITIFVQNNFGYGIIKQFQDAYFESRYFATGQGYTVPNFEAISKAYAIPYLAVKYEKELKEIQIPLNYAIVDMQFPPNSLITPKTEMDRFIHDQYPYISDNSITMLPHNYPQRPSALLDLSNPTV